MSSAPRRLNWARNHPEKLKEARLRYAPSEKGIRKFADKHLRRAYGITIESKEEMFAEQKGLCAWCGSPLPDVMSSHVDHDHVTKRVRGLLHSQCNILVGWMESHLDKVPLVVSYLNKFRTKSNNP